MREPFLRNRVIFARDRGGSSEEASSVPPLQVWLHEFEGGRVGFNVITGVDPGNLQRGPYEAPGGISPSRGQGKTGEGESSCLLDFLEYLYYHFVIEIEHASIFTAILGFD
jgi:hypothetical protein